MKQLLIILILGMLFISQTTKACCTSEYVGVYPGGTFVSTNTSFLIDFSETDFSLKNKISELVFIATSTKGKQFKLKVLQTNFSGTMGQVFLKVKTKLNQGDTISIQVFSKKGDILTGNLKSFSSQINYRKWVVNFDADKEFPVWTKDSIKYTTQDTRNSSAPSYEVILNTKINDNAIALPILFLVVFDNQKFICNSYNYKTSIYFGMCGSNFNFEIDKTYSATLTAIDASGNYSIDTKSASFTTTGNKEEFMIIDNSSK